MSEPSSHLSPEEFRKQAIELIDWIVGYMQNVEQFPVRSQVKPGEISGQLPPQAPEDHESFADVLHDLDQVIVPGLTHWQSPNFFAYFPANVSGPSILGELLSAALGQQGMLWTTSPACTELETKVLDWLVFALGLPEKFLSTGLGGGVIQDTASSAALCALVAARDREIARSQLPHHQALATLRIYVSQQTHSSLAKGARVAGFAGDQFIAIPTDASGAMNFVALQSAVQADVAAGFRPALICATVGTTSTQAVDPLPEIAQLALAHRSWLHVDAAMSGSAAICPEFREMHRGLEHADSYAFNPHKWLLTNFDCTAFYVASREDLLNSLSILPEYLRNQASDSQQVIDYRDWQIPLGRRFRALKLWFVLRHYGLSGLRSYIRQHVSHAQWFAQQVRQHPALELTMDPPLNLVCFRAQASDEINEALMAALNDSGELYLSHTKLNGRYILRLCIGQTHTNREHVERAFDRVCQALELVQSRALS